MATNVTARLEEQIEAIDRRIAQLETAGAAEITRLKGVKAALEGVLEVITPEIEAAVETLEKLGLLPGR